MAVFELFFSLMDEKKKMRAVMNIETITIYSHTLKELHDNQMCLCIL